MKYLEEKGAVVNTISLFGVSVGVDVGVVRVEYKIFERKFKDNTIFIYLNISKKKKKKKKTLIYKQHKT